MHILPSEIIGHSYSYFVKFQAKHQRASMVIRRRKCHCLRVLVSVTPPYVLLSIHHIFFGNLRFLGRCLWLFDNNPWHGTICLI